MLLDNNTIVMTSEEAASFLRIHPKTLQKLARKGQVPAFRLGDQWRFSQDALEEFIRQSVQCKDHSCLN